MRMLRPLCAALLLGLAGSTALAADTDAEYRLNELLGTDPQYRETWQNLVEDESRLPEWVMNLSGTATPMQAVNEDGDKYLVGQL
ncbi:Ivy family c-type lysozyme inhibitor, partial [Metapseudomonas otitidis]